ncbi:Tmc1 protein [Martiniozyma asiatica (nom. inval.)]|nr:Tmc1 protein [Martiniozyma asiatica]
MKLSLLLQPTETTEHSSSHKTISLSISDASSVSELEKATLAALAPSSPHNQNINLWFKGQLLNSKETLNYYLIEDNMDDLIYVTFDDSTPDSAIADGDCDENHIEKKKRKKSRSKSKSKSKRCSFNDCSSTPLRLVGDCQLCQGKFCSVHRLLESHYCKGLKGWKDTCFERNASKLQQEQTVASKV